jgi:hypothetical protein
MLDSRLEPKPKSANGSRTANGYRPLVPHDFTQGMGNAAYGYVAAAAVGMGMLVGVAVAVTTSQARVSAAPRMADSLSTHTCGLSMLPASYVGTTASLLSRIEPVDKPRAGSSQLLNLDDQGTHKHSHKKHGLKKLLNWKKSEKGPRAQKRMAYVSPKTQVAETTPVDQPTALELAVAAAARGPFYLGIQGDVTVANYNATTGTVQTYEGETYQLATNSSSTNSIAWQDYPFNVHYRCDGGGNCMLSHAGVSAIAKLAR